MTKLSIIALAATLAFTVTAANAAIFVAVPPKKPSLAISTENCQAEMGVLRTIRAAQLVERAEADKIMLYPICLGDEAGALRADGNAGGLIKTIAGNDILSAALADEDFAAEDVVGVRFGGGQSIILYVHPYR